MGRRPPSPPQAGRPSGVDRAGRKPRLVDRRARDHRDRLSPAVESPPTAPASVIKISSSPPQVEAEAERDRGAWWRRVAKPGLEALPDVEKPTGGRSEWRYTDK
jgi:hypothetical protein